MLMKLSKMHAVCVSLLAQNLTPISIGLLLVKNVLHVVLCTFIYLLTGG